MGRSVESLAGVLLCVMATVVCQEASVDLNLQAVATANNAFASELFKTYRNESGNLVLSPVSAEAVLAMLWLGTGGETSTELATGLQLPQNSTVVKEGFKKFLKTSKSTSVVSLDIANKIYIQQGFGVKQEYRDIIQSHFNSDVVELDFINQKGQARQSINQWVEEKTHNKIRNLIAPSTLTETTRLLLVNAVYFKGGWRHPFPKSRTVSEPFYTTPDTPVNVPMMHQIQHLPYGNLPNLDAKVLQLFYRGTNDDRWGRDATQSMILILPNEIDGLQRLESQLSSFNVTEIKSHVRNEETIVALPKFTIKKTVPLVQKLKEMGITKIFESGADFSGFTDENIYVSNVLQKAYIEVKEKGTTAAASTFLQVIPYSGSISPPEFIANHPFLFLIVDDSTDMILFIGRVKNPS